MSFSILLTCANSAQDKVRVEPIIIDNIVSVISNASPSMLSWINGTSDPAINPKTTGINNARVLAVNLNKNHVNADKAAVDRVVKINTPTLIFTKAILIMKL